MAAFVIAPPPPAFAMLARSVAERMQRDLEDLIRLVDEAILDASPALVGDPVLAEHTRASAGANVTRWVATMVEGSALRPGADLPPQALDLARDIVRRGIDHAALPTAYRVGQQVVWVEWMRCARDEGLDGDELMGVLNIGSLSLFAYVEDVLAAIARRIDEEREALVGGAPARRREIVMMILDGAPMTVARASGLLGYELDDVHTAGILWMADGTLDHSALERLASDIASALGAPRPFAVTVGTDVSWTWFSGVSPNPDALRSAVALAPAGVALTLGSPLRGLAGFRDSHSEALAAQRLLMGNPGGPTATTYADVEVVSLALAQEAHASAFVAKTLGDLRAAEPGLGETLRVYLREDCNSPRAAALLHTHRNTVLKRVRRAEALLPQPLAGRGFEVRLALELLRWRAT